VAANQTISAGGALTLAQGSGTALSVGGFASILNLAGASVLENATIVLPSGRVTLHATGAGSDVVVGGRLDVGGARQSFYDVDKYTDGGQVSLVSDGGSVRVAAGGAISVAAATGGGKGGQLSLSAILGTVSVDGTLAGQAGAAGSANGTFSLDVGSLPSLAALEAKLGAGSFSESQSLRVRTGNLAVDGSVIARGFTASADQGDLLVTGSVDAHGTRGGKIALYANGGITLANGATLSVAGDALDAAGKAGTVNLETRGAGGGVVSIGTGSSIDLSVAGGVGGMLYLRAPQVSPGYADVAVDPIAGTLVNAGSVVVEGFRQYAYNQASYTITSAQQTTMKNNAASFSGTANTAAMKTRLFAGDPLGIMHVRPGVEVVNSGGDLVLASDWDLSTWRFGPSVNPAVIGSGEPGTLTMRASGNLVFQGSLSDGFASGFNPWAGRNYLLYEQPLLTSGSRSWSYRLISGADFSASDFHQAKPLAQLGASAGSLQLGKVLVSPTTTKGLNAKVADVLGTAGQYYQVIRTGSGDIEVAAGRDVILFNQFASIYTAGIQVANPTVLPGGSFDLPVTAAWQFDGDLLRYGVQDRGSGSLYPAQYSEGGGNVTIFAGGDIAHKTKDIAGTVIMDAQSELPI
ncbi:MAG: hypothetical protein ACOYMV_14105, partial [Verrucomicrobiia bacterium]